MRRALIVSLVAHLGLLGVVAIGLARPRALPEPENVIRFPRWPLQVAAGLAIGFGLWWLMPRPAEK
ncbi:MAG: hypothetical protein N3D77_12465, partial [Geminicoccaceae bacterium]|nr:hypothetical protein [Geminicoccaceae bacterium]